MYDVIQQETYVPYHNTWHRTYKILSGGSVGVSSVIHNKLLATTPVFTLRVTFGGWGLVVRGTSLVIRGLEL